MRRFVFVLVMVPLIFSLVWQKELRIYFASRHHPCAKHWVGPSGPSSEYNYICEENGRIKVFATVYEQFASKTWYAYSGEDMDLITWILHKDERKGTFSNLAAAQRAMEKIQ